MKRADVYVIIVIICDILWRVVSWLCSMVHESQNYVVRWCNVCLVQETAGIERSFRCIDATKKALLRVIAVAVGGQVVGTDNVQLTTTNVE